jgi:esterase/lipase superfamily enzyme
MMREGSMRRTLHAAVAAVAAALVLAAPLTPAPAEAQTGGQHIEKVANRRLSGTSYARLTGISYAQCEARCLADAQCVALEHHRGGRIVFGRTAQCRLFSAAGEARSSNFADIGYKRPGPGRRPPSVAFESKKKGPAEPRKIVREEERGPPKAEAPPAPKTVAPPRNGERVAIPGPPAPAPARPVPPPAAPQPAPKTVAPPPPSTGAPPPTAGSPPPPPRVSQPGPAAPGTTPAPPSRPRAILKPSDPGAAAGENKEWDVVPVFYGTDRNRRDIPGKRIAYGSDRAGRVELGRALVTVPKVHQVPKLERPWKVTIPYVDVTLYEEKEDPRRHFTIQELRTLSRGEALALVRERLAASAAYRNQALVLIHGYNSGFDDALYRGAQVTYDLNFDGASFLYSWPSGSGLSQYLYDRDSAAQAEPHLAGFLQMVLNETGAEWVSVIAHSMGNQLLLPVLRYLKDRNPGVAARINQIILAAPDVDRDTFAYLASQIEGLGRGITMYASANDRALQVSRRFAGDKPRAGDVPSELGPAIVAGVDTIDISSLGTDYLAINHSTYAERTALLRDIELVLKTGERPPERRFPLYEKVTSDKGAYWRYPQ